MATTANSRVMPAVEKSMVFMLVWIVKRKSLLHVRPRGGQLAENSQGGPKCVVAFKEERWILGALCYCKKLPA
jgi:hypothetical protein